MAPVTMPRALQWLLLLLVVTVTAKGSPDVFAAQAAGDCTAHPKTSSGDHGAPVNDENISFILESKGKANKPESETMAASSVCPGYSYKVTVNNGDEPRDTLLTASIGELKAAKDKKCPNRSIGKVQSRTYTDELTIPCDVEDAKSTLELKVTSAAGKTDKYYQASIALPISSPADCPYSQCSADKKPSPAKPDEDAQPEGPAQPELPVKPELPAKLESAEKPKSGDKPAKANSTQEAGWDPAGAAALAGGAAALAGQAAAQPEGQQAAAPAEAETGAADSAAGGAVAETGAADPAAGGAVAETGAADPAAGGAVEAADGAAATDSTAGSDPAQASTTLGSDVPTPAADEAATQDSTEVTDVLDSPAAMGQDSGLQALATILGGGRVNSTDTADNITDSANDTLSTWADAWGGNSSADSASVDSTELPNDIAEVQAASGRPNSNRQGFWAQLFGLLMGRRPDSTGAQSGSLFGRPSQQGAASSMYDMQGSAYGSSSAFDNAISAADNAAAEASRPRREAGSRKLLQATATTAADASQGQAGATLEALGLGAGRQTGALGGAGNGSTPLLEQFVRGAAEARAARRANSSFASALSPSASGSVLGTFNRPGTAGFTGSGLGRNVSILGMNATGGNGSLATEASFQVLRMFQRIFGSQRQQAMGGAEQQQAQAFGGRLQQALAATKP